MANPFDQFDAPKSNPFDQFDEPPKPVGGFGASAKQALGSLVKGAGQAAEDFLPASIGKDNAIKKYGQSVIDANPTAVQGFSDIADSPWMATKEATGNAAGSMGSMLGIRALGMGITAASPLTGPFAPATALAGQAVANVGPFVAAALPSFGGIREKQIAKDPNSTASMQDKALAAAGAGTVGLIEGKFGPQAWAMKAMTKEGRAQLAKGLAETTLAKGVGYGALKGAAVEGAEELVQNPIEQLASYEDPRTPQNVKETLFGGAMGAIGGGVLGGATGAANQMLDRTPPAAPNLAPTDQAPAVPPAIEPSSLQSAPASQSALPGQTQQVSPSSTGSLPQNTLSNQSPNQSLDQAGSPLGSPGTKEAESLAAREAEVQQIVAASGGNPGALAKVAIASIQSGASGEIQLQQANEADQAAYEQAKAEQDRQAAEQDTANQSLTKIAEKQAYAAMSEEDKRAILFSNKTVADGGIQYPGTLDGDILNGQTRPYKRWEEAIRRVKMEGKDWRVAKVQDGFVARRKDANGPSTEIQSGDTGSTGVRSTDSPASVGVGATDGNGVGAQSGRSPDAVLDQADQLPKRTDAAPVATTRAQPTTLGKQTTATAGLGFTAKDVTRVPNPAPRADTTPAAQAVEAPAVVESNAAATEGLPAAGSVAVEGAGVTQADIEAKADELMGLIEAMGGNTSITRESTIALIKEKGMDAADKSIAGFKKHIADTKKRISYRDKSQPQEQPNAQAAEAIESTPKPEAGTDSSIPKPAAVAGVEGAGEVAGTEPNLQAAKNLLAQQKAATGNAVAEGHIRKKLRDLAAITPQDHAATVMALDTAATRLGMGEGKLKGLEFAPATKPVSDTQTADAPAKPDTQRITTDKAEMRPYRKPDGSVGYEDVPIYSKESDQAIVLAAQKRDASAAKSNSMIPYSQEEIDAAQRLSADKYQDQAAAQKPPQAPANTAQPATESVAKPREAIEHAGVKIYPITFKGEPHWSVQSEDNRTNGKVLGDTIHATLEGAKQSAEEQVRRVKSKQERNAAYEAEQAAAQAKKDANKGKSLADRKRDFDLDKPTKLPVQAGLGTGTRRESMQKAVDQDRHIASVMVEDTAAKKKDKATLELVRARGYILGASNENIPLVKQGLEAQARLKANKYEKPEYRVYSGRDDSGSFYEISKTEYDYAQELKEKQATRETITPADDKNIGVNLDGNQLYERKDGSVYQMQDGKPRFSGFLEPVSASKEAVAPADTAQAATETIAKPAQTVESVARAVQQKIAANRRKAREKSRKEYEAKGWKPNSTPESEQADYDTEVNAKPSEHGEKYAAALLGDNPLPLIEMFVHGNFEASEDVFKDITGVKIRGLSAADKKAALYKWANWTPEQIAKAEADDQARNDKRAEKNKQEDAKTRVMGEWAALLNLNIGEPGTKGIDGQEFVLQAVAKGYDKAHSQKKGVATIYGLTNGKEFTTLKKGAFTDFVKAAIAFGGLDKTLEYVNPPMPQKPAGFVDRSIETGKDAGMIAKAFAPTESETKPTSALAEPAPVAIENVASEPSLPDNWRSGTNQATNRPTLSYNPQSGAHWATVRNESKAIQSKEAKPAQVKPDAAASVPKSVQDHVKWALTQLRDIEDALESVRRARGDGHILALEVKDQEAKQVRPNEILDEFREHAKKNGIDAEAVIDALGGVPDLARFSQPASGGNTEASQREFRNPDNLNVLHAPIEDKDWFKLKNGEEWQARQGYSGRGWSLVRNGNLHPEARNFDSQSDFIRSVVDVTSQTQAAGQVAAIDGDLRGYAYALVKNGQIITSGSFPSKANMEADDTANISNFKKEADAKGADIYIGGYPGADAWTSPDGLIFGMTFDELNAKQQKRTVPASLKGKMPTNAVVAYEGQAKPEEASDEPIPAVTEAQARKQFEWRNMGQKDGTKSHLLFFFESEKDKGTGAAMNRGEVSLYPGASGWKVEDGDGTSYKSLADAKKAAIDLAIPKLQDQGYILKPAQAATAILDAANVTGKERIDALKDVKKGDITPEELQAAYPAKEDGEKTEPWKMTRAEAAESFPGDEYDKMLNRHAVLGDITYEESNKRSRINITGNKEFWAKTRKELLQDKKDAVKFARGDRAEVNKMKPTEGFAAWRIKSMSATGKAAIEAAGKYHDELLAVHKERVQEALDEGKDVPAEVLADYPDLAKPDNSVKPEAKSEISDFGEVLPGARKDAAPSLKTELSDNDIATQPLSKIWPADEYLSIDDKFASALSFAARAEIPAKPRTSYKVKNWVEKVKTVRDLAQRITSGSVTRERMAAELAKTRSLSAFADKIALLEAIDREHWPRIDSVEVYPDAYRYNDDGTQTKTPLVRVSIDGRSRSFDGATSVADVVERVIAMVDTEQQQTKKMQFEVRGTESKGFGINKKGDKEYRKLKTFPTAKEAFEFIKAGYDDLVAEWEGIKDRDNVKKDDVRGTENRPRSAKDYRNGKDVTSEQFAETFGFRGGQFGKWVNQGEGRKDRQGMLNQAYDALMDLSDIVGIPPRAVSLNGTLGLAFGARGSGTASAHYEPDTLVINLTKTRGAGVLAHEWFHALDNYFSHQRGGAVPTVAGMSQLDYRKANYITYKPEPLYVHKTKQSTPITKATLDRYAKTTNAAGYYNPENWHLDPRHPEGVRPEVERRIAELVEALNASPMAQRAAMNDKAPEGYWSRIIERAARSFENYVISKMMERGYHNDYLANVREVGDFPRSKERYPYLLPEEVKPIAEAFDNLFATVQTKETDKGVAMFSTRTSPPEKQLPLQQIERLVQSALRGMKNAPTVRVVANPEAIGLRSPVDTVPSGVTLANGDVYVFQSGVGSALDVDMVVFHELFHKGLQNVMPRSDYVAAMQDIAKIDAKVRQYASEWSDSNAGKDQLKELAKKYSGKELADQYEALATEEGLARIAEDLKAKREMGSKDMRVRRLVAWLAKVADKIGMTRLAESLRAMSYSEAEKFVIATIGRAGGSSKYGVSVAAKFSFAGRNASTADTHALTTARDRLASGEDAETVRRDTGWFKGVDGKMRFEINDKDAKLKIPFKPMDPFVGNLYDALDHPALFAAYPGMKAMRVVIQYNINDTGGEWSALRRTINVERDTKEKALSTLLHEIQHGIQTIEGFTSGGSEISAMGLAIPENVRSSMALSTVNKVAEAKGIRLTESQKLRMAEQVSLWNNAEEEKLDQIAQEAGLSEQEISYFFIQDFYEIYRRFAGEVEARNVQSRQNMTDTERRSQSPESTADVKTSDVIVMFDGKVMRNAPTPANALNEPTAPDSGGARLPQTETSAFKAWFGKSAVVDADGNPLVVYHGTHDDFSEFKGDRHWFTSDTETANTYASRIGMYGGNVMPVYLSMSNPKVIDASGSEKKWHSAMMEWANKTPSDKRLSAQGHDGVLFKHNDMIVAYVFRPEQIKSAISNNGNFDASNPDIRFRAADTLSSAANNVRNVKLPAGYLVGDLINGAPGKLNWWHRSVGTMYNLAQRSAPFKRVFDSVQTFINDVSYYATEAADLAPNILPKLETWKDIAKSPLSAADTKAISAPIFEGTLIWMRDDVTGQAVKVDELKGVYAKRNADRTTRNQARRVKYPELDWTLAKKKQALIDGGFLDAKTLKMWEGQREGWVEKVIEGKFEKDLMGVEEMEVEPTKATPGIVFTDAELKSIFNLTDKQIPLYREFRKATDKSLTNLAIADMLRFGGEDVAPIREQVLASKDVSEAAETLRDYLLSLTDIDPDRADVLTDTADKMIEKGDRAKDLIDRGYAPLSRFGQYTLDVVHDGERVYFSMFESKWEAARMNRQMQAEYPGAKITQGTVSEQAYKMFAGVSPETLELFGDMLGLEAQGDSAASQAFQEYLKLAKSSRSAMKRLIHRKGIAGFNEDAGRVLAGFVYSNARQTASSLHMGEMTNAANDISQTQGELKDAAVKLVDYIKNPQEEAQKLRGLLFAQYIGGSVASAMVNMTQPLTMTFPWLSQYGGVASAAKQMTAAMKDSGKKLTGDAKLDAALHRAEEDGTVSPQEVHQLLQQSMGKGALQSGDGTTAGNAMATANNTLSRFSLGWGKLFSVAEQFNRRVTFIAAYRTAVTQGMADPDAFARKAVAETQGIYNRGNKPQWARGALGSTLFTFKQYSIAYVEMLSRMAKAGKPGSKERAQGQKAALLALGVLFLMSGAGGMPGADDLDDLISGALQALGYNFDSKARRKEFFVSLFGEGGAQFVERGVSGLPGVPIDVSGRMGLGNLIPGTGLFTKKTDHTRDVAELAGPAGDLAKRTFEAAGKLIKGDAVGSAVSVSPKAFQNLHQAYDMANMGMYRDASGKKVVDTDGYDAIAKAIGFQPTDVKRIQDASIEVQRMIGLNKMRESEIADKWALGMFEKNPAKVEDARNDLKTWNADNPSSPIRINFGQIIKRVQKMNETKTQRIAKTAPREIRETVRRELATQ